MLLHSNLLHSFINLGNDRNRKSVWQFLSTVIQIYWKLAHCAMLLLHCTLTKVNICIPFCCHAFSNMFLSLICTACFFYCLQWVWYQLSVDLSTSAVYWCFVAWRSEQADFVRFNVLLWFQKVPLSNVLRNTRAVVTKRSISFENLPAVSVIYYRKKNISWLWE